MFGSFLNLRSILFGFAQSCGNDISAIGVDTAELISDHYAIETLPPVASRVADLESKFTHVDWHSNEDSIISLYKRTSIAIDS